MLSGSVDELERVTERFLDGFGELRTPSRPPSPRPMRNRCWAGPGHGRASTPIIEGATGQRDALIWPALGKSREAFTAMLVAANAYYLSLAIRLGRGRPPQHRDDRDVLSR